MTLYICTQREEAQATATCASPASLPALHVYLLVEGDWVLHLQHSSAKLGLIRVQSWDVKTNNEHIKTTATHTERSHLPVSGRSSSVSPVPEMFIAPVRNQESHSLSSSLFSTHCPWLTISFDTSAQSEDWL